MIPEGMIALGTPAADELGFIADRFEGWLWKRDDKIIVSFIMSRQPGRGHFSELLDGIWSKGYTIQVPTPLGQMVPILQAKGFEPHAEWSESFGDWCEVWERAPDDQRAG